MRSYREMILERLQEMYPAYEFKVNWVVKNNGCGYDGIYIKLPVFRKCVPIIPCRCYEERLERGVATMDEVLEEIRQQIEERTELNALNLTEFDLISRSICLRVVNYERNKEMLAKVPHRRFLDLAVVCRILIKVSDTEQGSALITNALLSEWKITEQELMELAYQNTFEENSVQIHAMRDVLDEILGEEKSEVHGVTIPKEDVGMYVANMGEACGGGVCILQKDAFREFAKSVEKDLYLLPSSLHELVVLTKDSGTSEAYLKQMVKEINRDMVLKEEVLSNHVYFYDRKQDEIFDLGEAED